MKRRFWIFLGAAAVLAALALAAGAAWLMAGLPDARNLPAPALAPAVRFTDRHGRLLYEWLDPQTGRYTPLEYDQFPTALVWATVATEDASFFDNPGVDLRGILRSLWINLRNAPISSGETLAGGSTITQQVARRLLLSPEEASERTLRRKMREAILAWQMTRLYTKEEILTLYLNQAYYGSLAYGVEAAAQTYFGKPAASLNLAESAMLAGLVQAPAVYDPFQNPETAKARQGIVLGLMREHNWITPEEYELASREVLVYTSASYPLLAPHFVLWVRAGLSGLVELEGRQETLVVRTTLDLDAQRKAEAAVQNQMALLAEADRTGLGHNVNNAALVTLDPTTGEVLALVGSPNYADAAHGGALNMAMAPRQPGSALKPLVYAAAFDPTRLQPAPGPQPAPGSQPWTAATMLLDVSTTFLTREGQPYTPVNYDGLEHGPVLARTALASSFNIPAVLTLEHVGLPALVSLASSLGITTLGSPDQYDLSLALGGGDVRLLELTAAYAAFANGGYRITPFAVLDIQTLRGEMRYQAPQPVPVQVLDPRVAWLVTDILSDNDARTPGFGPNSTLRIGRAAAVKTGTTTSFHDNWTVGYTPELVTGVWVGNASHDPMRNITGLTGAAPIWHQHMRSLLEGLPDRGFPRPDGLVRVEVCALSGLLPTPACPYNRMEWFIQGTQPAAPDTLYRQETLDTRTGGLAGPATPPEFQRRVTALDLPPQAQAWARSQNLLLWSDILARSGAAGGAPPGQPTAGQPALSLLSPAPNTTYQLAAGVAPENQRILVEAAYAGSAAPESLSLYVNGDLIAAFSAPPYRAWWPLTPGQHLLWAEASLPGGGVLSSSPVGITVKP